MGNYFDVDKMSSDQRGKMARELTKNVTTSNADTLRMVRAGCDGRCMKEEVVFVRKPLNDLCKQLLNMKDAVDEYFPDALRAPELAAYRDVIEQIEKVLDES